MKPSSDAGVHEALALPSLGDEAPGFARPGLGAVEEADTVWAPPEVTPSAGRGRDAFARTGGPAEEAYARGRADGVRDGAAQAESLLRPVLERIERVAATLAASRSRFEHDRERNVHALALAVARKVIHRELAADPELVRGLVARALELMPAASAIDVRLHPDDLEALGDRLQTLVDSGRGELQWLPDPSLERGSFMIESPLRIVDGRTDVALRELYERLDHDDTA